MRHVERILLKLMANCLQRLRVRKESRSRFWLQRLDERQCRRLSNIGSGIDFAKMSRFGTGLIKFEVPVRHLNQSACRRLNI